MNDRDTSFLPSEGLDHALKLLQGARSKPEPLPKSLPERGLGEMTALDKLSDHVFGKAARLDSRFALAHMDPPTPWITWATALWNASLNQNLLHEATSPFAAEAEKLVIDWLGPYFGMQGGHFCAGSSIANLTALWAARDSKGVKKIVASESAHLSVEKAARILGLELKKIPVDDGGQLDRVALGPVDDACLVLTAGTTATGVIDPLELAGRAAWTHVDAAWAGPLRLSPQYSALLKGVDRADSVAVSAHKWLFQPKDSAVVLFRQVERACATISFGGGYLASPNVGVQGSRGAAAIPLLATLLAWGREGIASRIERTMSAAEKLAGLLEQDEDMTLWAMPTTAVNVFRPIRLAVDEFITRIPEGMLSTCVIGDERWLRSVSVNPLADIDGIYETIAHAKR